MSKLKILKDFLKSLKKVLIAYSGGIDSTFLLYFAVKTLGRENVIPVIARSETYPLREFKFAERFVKKLKLRYSVIHTSELKIKNFKKNPVDRCYYCKKELFSRLRKIAQKNGIKYVLDGSNFSDLSDYRPGFKAKKETKVLSPLIEAKLTKDEIKKFTKKFNLPTKDKGSFTCLASRFPYGEEITEKKLRMIDKAEDYLFKLGFKEFRIRYHNLGYNKIMARIEINRDEFKKIKPFVMDKICNHLKKYFDFITLDLEGYQTGKLNKLIGRNS